MRLVSRPVNGFTPSDIAFAVATEEILAGIKLLPSRQTPNTTGGSPKIPQLNELVRRLQSIERMLETFPGRIGLTLQMEPGRQPVSAQLAGYGKCRQDGNWTWFALFRGIETLSETSEEPTQQTLCFPFILDDTQWGGHGQAGNIMTVLVLEPADGAMPSVPMLFQLIPRIGYFRNLLS